jgi:hypothetical protein
MAPQHSQRSDDDSGSDRGNSNLIAYRGVAILVLLICGLAAAGYLIYQVYRVFAGFFGRVDEAAPL